MLYDEVAFSMTEMSGNSNLSAKALQILTLTTTRTFEVIKSKWEEVVPDKAIWTIPAERMKTRRENKAPLSNQAKTIITSLPQITDKPALPVSLGRSPCRYAHGDAG